MKAILIDTDSHSLNVLEKHLIDLSEIKIVGRYNDPYVGKEAVISEAADVLFLEARLPSLSGIVLAKQLKQVRPHLNIVFISDYEQYALDAYNISAIDYVMKPLQQSRLEKTIRRLEANYLKGGH